MHYLDLMSKIYLDVYCSLNVILEISEYILIIVP